MVYRVLIVDDSSFFQLRLKEIINEHPELDVVGIASNGNEAIEMAHQLKPDIISMDYEMPFLDGVSAVKVIMEECPVPIIMFSSMTFDGARITLDALEAGALDFLPKNFAEVSRNAESLKRKIHDMLLTFAKKGVVKKAPGGISSFRQAPGQAEIPTTKREFKPSAPKSFDEPAIPSSAPVPSRPVAQKRFGAATLRNNVKLVIVGASTGGPLALSEVLCNLPSNYPVPVVVIQHMPPNFTKALAERLNNQCNMSVKEAQHGDQLKSGKVYIAPGGLQLMFDSRARNSLKIIEGDERVNYKPSLDIAFASAANTYNNGVLGVVLTGMGSDGCEGAKILKEKGSHLWAQDEASCVVYGMPKAVREANLTDEVVKLADIGPRLTKVFN